MRHQVIYLYTISSLLLGIWGPFFAFPSSGEGLASMLTSLCPCSHGEALCMSHQVSYLYTNTHYYWAGWAPFSLSRAVGTVLAGDGGGDGGGGICAAAHMCIQYHWTYIYSLSLDLL
jgi:hypothetical protein